MSVCVCVCVCVRAMYSVTLLQSIGLVLCVISPSIIVFKQALFKREDKNPPTAQLETIPHMALIYARTPNTHPHKHNACRNAQTQLHRCRVSKRHDTCVKKCIQNKCTCNIWQLCITLNVWIINIGNSFIFSSFSPSSVIWWDKCNNKMQT